MRLTIYQVDAFAANVFEGNPAAVVPLQSWPDDELLQKIALENNLSETAFFIPADGDAQPAAHFELRWFTPEYEIDLCGHATLASAYVIKNFVAPHLGEIVFATRKAGLLRATARDGAYTLDFPARPPQPCTPPDNLLKSLGTGPAVEILKSRDYFVVLPDEDAVLNVEPDYTLMKELDTIGVIVTARGRSADVVSRCFYPGAGVPEDPVTGSAHCNIVPYWAGLLGRTELVCRQVSARGGTLHCTLDGDRVLMTGTCVLYLEGTIEV